MLEQLGCDHTLRFAVRHRDLTAPRATRLEHRLALSGAFCECEIVLHIVELHPRSSSTPRCGGVRLGCTRMCENRLGRRG